MALTPEFWKNYVTSRKDNADTSYYNLDHFSVSVSTKHDDPIYNWVGYFHDERATVIIEEVVEYFTNINKSFMLTVNNTDPVELKHDQLIDHGFSKIGSYVRMVAAPDQLLQDTITNRYEIRVIGPKELLSDDNIAIIQACFPQYFPDADAIREYMQTRVDNQQNQADRTIIELGAFDPESDKMVGNASMLIKDDLPGLAEMAGSAVLPDHRKQGIYSAFLHTRAQYAIKHDIDHIFIIADEESSAPIVRKFGFTEVEKLKDYQYVQDD